MYIERPDSIFGCEDQEVKSRIVYKYLKNHLKYNHLKYKNHSKLINDNTKVTKQLDIFVLWVIGLLKPARN